MRLSATTAVLASFLAAPHAPAQTWKTWADSFPDPIYPTSDREKSAVTEEVQYIYTVRRYTPPVPLEPVARAAASYATPEATAVAMLSAVASRDREWWLSGFAEEARVRLAASEADAERAGWHAERTLAGRRVELTHRIETGPFVIVAYRLASGDPRLAGVEAKQSPGLIVTKQVGERWLATDELEGDPVARYWTNPGVRLRRIER